MHDYSLLFPMCADDDEQYFNKAMALHGLNEGLN